MTIAYLLGGFAALLAALWAPFSLIPLGSYYSRMNRQIRDFERPHPEEVRNNKLVVGQFVPMSVVTLMAGTLAGIGASLFVYDGRLGWPSSQVPLALLGFAIFVAEFGGDRHCFLCVKTDTILGGRLQRLSFVVTASEGARMG